MTENEYQSEIMSAIAAYCGKNDLIFTNVFTYANQQGEKSTRACFDFMSIISNRSPLYAEVKVQDCSKNELIRFEDDQYIVNCHLQSLNVPIKYVYNNTDNVAGLSPNKTAASYVDTLKESNFSEPTRLSGKKPDQVNHSNLWNWIESQSSSAGPEDSHDSISEFGVLCGALSKTESPNNGLLILMYSTEGRFISGLLNKTIANKYINLAKKTKKSGFTNLSVKQQSFLRSLLAGVESFDKISPVIEKEIIESAAKKADKVNKKERKRNSGRPTLS
ncbi:hypothetical protein [Enterobacter wuhouensis]|uniref:hypothetical protein n=1 Tax=Enterobacter wuhouensis TaxID=2529381 RepID=UPI003523C307